MFKYFFVFLFLYNYSFCYEDSFEDIMNQYLYRENITKLLLVKKEANIRSCNDIKCDVVKKVPENTLLVSSNFDKNFYQIRINEWISFDLIEEIKIFNQKDYILKKNLSPYNSYILYKGIVKNNKDISYNIKKEILLETNYQNLILDSNRKLNNFTILKEDKNSSIIKLNFTDLLKIDLSIYSLFNELIKDKDFVLNDNQNKSFFDF